MIDTHVSLDRWARTLLFLTLFAISPLASHQSYAKKLNGTETAIQKLNKMSKEQIFEAPMEELEPLVGESIKDACPFELEGDISPLDKKLTTTEICAVHHYTTSSFTYINKDLWSVSESGKGISGKNWGYIRVLDFALSKIPPTRPSTVYRGTTRQHLKFDRVGDVTCLKSYTSTSVEKDVATWFLKGLKNNDRLMVIKTFSARDISSMSGVYEHEYLIPRDRCFVLDRKEIKEITITPEETQVPEKRRVEFVYLNEVEQN